MTTGQRFSGYPAVFGYATGQTLALADLRGWDVTPNNSVGVSHPPGAIDPAAFLVSRSKPTFRLQTADLGTLFGVVGFQSGKCFDEASTFTLQERSDCGTFEAGATHSARKTTKAFMYLDSISAEEESEDGAQANMVFHPLYDGSNDIVQYLAAQALPGTSPAYVTSYFLGPVYVNSVEIPGVMSQTWSPQIRFQPSPASPGCFDTVGSIIQRDASFTVRCLKIDEFDAHQITGNNISVAWDLYLQKADSTDANNNGRIAAANAVHIKASFQSGRTEVQSLTVDGVEDAAVELVVTPSGSITFSTVSAIP